MIYEGCIQLTAVLIFLQLTGSLLALVRESILPFPALAGGGQDAGSREPRQGWRRDPATPGVHRCSLCASPQNLWAALLRGRKLEWDIWVFQEFYLKHCKGLEMEAPVEYSTRQPQWSKKDLAAWKGGFPRQAINATCMY